MGGVKSPMNPSPPLVFLGGTCGKNNWRPRLIKEVHQVLPPGDPASYVLFDPVVADWNKEAQAREEEMKRRAHLHVYYLASPKLESPTDVSAYSLVEATMALYDRPESTLVVFDNSEITGHSREAMDQAQRVLRTRFPGVVLDDYSSLVDLLVHRLVYGMIR
jgi:hypothetical protein